MSSFILVQGFQNSGKTTVCQHLSSTLTEKVKIISSIDEISDQFDIFIFEANSFSNPKQNYHKLKKIK